jgi:hypothetical protein
MRALQRSLICSLLLVAAPAPAAEIEGVSFRDRIAVGGVELVLNGTGLVRYRYFFKVYVAALYLGSGVAATEQAGDVPKRLEIQYFYEIGAKDFAASTWKGIAANVGEPVLERLRPKIEQLNALYRDVKPGDRYALTYLPDTGTELALNGRRLGLIPGSEFAAAVFAIWLGDSPLDPSLKESLLGGR